MGDKERSIAPKLRPGEKMPVITEGKVPTRYYGEIVGVSAPENGDSFIGNSGYTERQLRELNGIPVSHDFYVRKEAGRKRVVGGSW